MLVLVTRGRKTGTVHETPIAYWPNTDGSWLICASGNGAAKHPAW